jgi:hypothetical protein
VDNYVNKIRNRGENIALCQRQGKLLHVNKFHQLTLSRSVRPGAAAACSEPGRAA